MGGFSELDDNAVLSIFTFSPPTEVLGLATLCRSMEPVARSNDLWWPQVDLLAREYPLGGWPESSVDRASLRVHTAARLTLPCLLFLPVRTLRDLGRRLEVT